MLCLTFLASLGLATFPHWWRFVVCSVLCLGAKVCAQDIFHLPRPAEDRLHLPVLSVLPGENSIANLRFGWEKLDYQAESPH